ncbi:hypothetical protein [Chamaesiphon polymorphus]|uniref:Uncharacterized protein n=1 Tax=Chamaesiphon polymorphus CCALA 037 TaxID=2107692 RepID=A0A2T1GHI0_9CYAN|nr:hypothetical protein [Chamaesiphon polymorphus]PSB57140.1 hypothetical protein C7B77_09375 [Chamaesiphon polymorphus CCALA 037]
MSHELLLLDYIKAHWRQHQPAQLDRGVWIALHEEVTAEAYDADTPVVKAWFMTNRKIDRCALISFKIFAENRLQVRANESHEMGEANIAPYPTAGLYYLDFLFAPLWGGGMKVEIDDRDKVIDRGRLWVS